MALLPKLLPALSLTGLLPGLLFGTLPSDPQQELPGSFKTIRAEGFVAPATSIRSGGGALRKARAETGLRYFRPAPGNTFGLQIDGGVLQYSGTEREGLAATLGTVDFLKFSGQHFSSVGSWETIFFSSVETAADRSAALGDAWFLSGALGLRYPLTERFSTGFGSLFSQGTNDRLRVYPWIALRYQITEALFAETRNGLLLGYQPGRAPVTVFSVSVLYEATRFATRLDDSESKAIVRDRGWYVQAEASLLKSRSWDLRFYARTTFHQGVRLMRDGNRVDKFDLRPGTAFGLESRLTF